MDPATEIPVLWSVLTVENRGFGFLSDRRRKILFERHIFYRETGGRFAAEAPDICARSGGGHIGGAAEYERLDRALRGGTRRCPVRGDHEEGQAQLTRSLRNPGL